MISAIAKSAGWQKHGNGLWLPGMSFGQMGPACCCGSATPCNACDDETPLSFLCTVAGFADATCTTCTKLNGAYEATQRAACYWQYDYIDLPCGVDWAQVRVGKNGVYMDVAVLTYKNPYFVISGTLSATVDVGTNCQGIDHTFTINILSNPGYCQTGTTGTVRVQTV